jgi:glutaminase
MDKTGRDFSPDELERAVEELSEELISSEDWGKPSGLVPELSKVDVRQFGLAVVTRDGHVITGGKADQAFSIQSISKVFSLTLALEWFGEEVWNRVGREPSGDPYNSIVDLERHKGKPRNPFINAGALVVVDMLLQRREKDKDAIPDFVRKFLERKIGDSDFGIDESVWKSEQSSSFTNRALANLAKGYENLLHDVDDVMTAYLRQCAIALSCRQLALAGRYLMLERVDEPSGVQLQDALRARRVSALMLTCGQYDGSGDFAYRVGLPAKSGVGGGILAVVPNKASVAVWSPGLDENGNSLLGTIALERLAERMDWSVFGSARG